MAPDSPSRPIERRDFLKTLALTGGALGLSPHLGSAGGGSATSAAASPPADAATARRPNILFIMTDQQRFDAVGAHGGQVRTPHLDRLASRGADLLQFFTQAPVCLPSRQNLFTGRQYIARKGEPGLLLPPEIHLFKVLKQAGYHLGYTGKNHLLEEPEFANFDMAEIHLTKHRVEGQSAERTRFQELQKQSGERLTTHGAWASSCFFEGDPRVTDTYLCREAAVRFLQEAPSDRPFCLTVSFNDPHVPHVAPAKFRDWYPLDRIRLPETAADALDGKAPRLRLKQEGQQMSSANPEDLRRYLAVYWSMVSWVDENVGGILEALEATGRARDTIIVFTSDHGDFGCDYGLVKKDLVLLDVLLHVPCLFVWEGRIQPRAIGETLVEQIDVMPTLLDLCGLPAPVGCQGRSLQPLLRGATDRHKDEVYAEVCRPESRNPYPTFAAYQADRERYGQRPGHLVSFAARYNVPGDYTRALRTTDWKYIWYTDEFEELYDLRNDPGEKVNLASRPEHRARCAEMKERLWACGQTFSDYRPSVERAAEAARYDRWK